MDEKVKQVQCKYQGYEGYTIYSDGSVLGTRFRGGKRGRVKPWMGRGGYLKISLWNKGWVKSIYIHRLLCDHFLENPSGKKEVNHLDGEKLNNALINLEWATASENRIHAVKTNLLPPALGEKNGKHKLKVEEVLQIRSSRLPRPQLARLFGVTRSAIQHVQEHRNWKHIQTEVAHV